MRTDGAERLAVLVMAAGYNNFDPPLLGLMLERATGMPVPEYLSLKLWQPLGMESSASWTIDSDAAGFAKMESGINARAVDFAKLGRLMLRPSKHAILVRHGSGNHAIWWAEVLREMADRL